jgi:hypothetical protein
MTSLILQDTPLQHRRRFVGGVIDVVGRSNIRAFYVPSPTEGAVALDEVIAGRTWTHANTPSGRITRQGNGFVVAYNGSSDLMTVPDANDLSFGDGTNDSPFSVVSMMRTPSIATGGSLLIKFATQLEWGFQIVTSKPRLFMRDESVPVSTSRLADAALLDNRWYVLGASYSDVTGSATAGDDMLHYVDGQVVASTATNNAGYVAMENQTHPVLVGNATFGGQLGFSLLVGALLSAAQMSAISNAAYSYYRL